MAEELLDSKDSSSLIWRKILSFAFEEVVLPEENYSFDLLTSESDLSMPKNTIIWQEKKSTDQSKFKMFGSRRKHYVREDLKWNLGMNFFRQ